VSLSAYLLFVIGSAVLLGLLSKPRIVVTDAGPWYSILSRLGLNHLVVSGGIRSYVERFNASLKTYRWFHSVLHCTCSIRAIYGSDHLSGFLTLFMLYYNFIRPTRALDTHPLIHFCLGGGIKTRHYRMLS